MKRCLLVVNEDKLNMVRALLDEYNVEYYLPGHPNGKVELKESYPSKINLHAEMTEYAKLKGFESLTKAIERIGGCRYFRMMFNK